VRRSGMPLMISPATHRHFVKATYLRYRACVVDLAWSRTGLRQGSNDAWSAAIL
jgi:hypothetical protein